jgi:hypothetical protein
MSMIGLTTVLCYQMRRSRIWSTDAEFLHHPSSVVLFLGRFVFFRVLGLGVCAIVWACFLNGFPCHIKWPMIHGTTFSQLFDNFLTTFCNFLQLFENFLATFWQLFDNFWQLLDNFWQLFDNFLKTFYNFLTTFWQLFDKFLTTFWQLFDNFFFYFLTHCD